MTSTPIQTSQLQQPVIQTNQPMILKQGQVFQGTIKKLYPDQMAEVQVGNQKLFAKLETPLKVGDSHFFQVTNMNPQTEIKVVTGPMQHSETTSQEINRLLEMMKLPKTDGMQKLLAHFIKNQLPIVKETIAQAEQWLNKLPEGPIRQDALVAIQRMVEMKLPFTNEIFNALLYGGKTNGISSVMNHFVEVLKADSTLSESVKSTITQTLQTISNPLSIETGGVVLSKMLQSLMGSNLTDKIESLTFLKEAQILSNNETAQNWLTESFQKVQSTAKLVAELVNITKDADLPLNIKQLSSLIEDSTISQQQKNQLLQLLNGLKAAPKGTGPNEFLLSQLHKTNLQEQRLASGLIQSVISTNPEEAPKMIATVNTWLQDQQLINGQQKANLHQLINRFDGLPKTSQIIELFAKQLHEQLITAFLENSTSKLFETDKQGYSTRDHLLSLLRPDSISNMQETFINMTKVANESSKSFVQNVMAQSEAQLLSSIDGKAMEYAIKTILKNLGLSYEAILNSKAEDIQESIHSLKPQLVSIVQETHISTSIKEAAEGILARLNGMQLHSGENGHQHQLIMQIPLQFFGKNADATVEWNGRMKEDGKIDANYARILFYLNMESLQETVVDMQVQNRIVTIHLYNNIPNLDQYAHPLKESLKKGLQHNDYHLSGLFFKQFEKTERGIVKGESKKKQDPNKISGVDFRI